MPGTSKKSLKRKRDAEKARTNALFTGDAFFAIDTGADEAARAKVQREEVARHSAKADTGSSTEPQPATKGSHTVLEESSSESEAADSDAEGAGDELFMNIESSTKPAPGLEDSDPSDLEEESFRQQFEAETEARSNPRYYAPAEKADKTKQCTRCKQYGHLQDRCPLKLCSTCGALDQHETRFCPHNMICRRCGVKGHKAQECQQRGIPYESHCSRCGSSQHPSSTCPKIYKSYRELPKQSQQPKKDFRFACYNCASDRHFGTECVYPRGHPQPLQEASVFSNGRGRPEISKSWPTQYSKSFSSNRPPPPTARARPPHIVNGVRQSGPSQAQRWRERERERSNPIADYDDLVSNVRSRNSSNNDNDRNNARRGAQPKTRMQIDRSLASRLGPQLINDPRPAPSSSNVNRRSEPRPLPSRPPPPGHDRPPSKRFRSKQSWREPDADMHLDYGFDAAPPLPSSSRPAPPPSTQVPPPHITSTDDDDPWASQRNRRPTFSEAYQSHMYNVSAPTKGPGYGRKPKNRTRKSMHSGFGQYNKSDHLHGNGGQSQQDGANRSQLQSNKANNEAQNIQSSATGHASSTETGGPGKSGKGRGRGNRSRSYV